jgi:2-polyprenyl-6-methoxyphenol hydroxylase-like FAD-dependent oxidoreductase
MGEQEITARCCVVGGGPAGMMLGFLLARAGVDTIVLEKHADFLRDFRGDTIHPSTLAVMDELGLLDDFLKLPHQEVRQLSAQIGDRKVTVADFSHLPRRYAFVAFLPQWDFLDFLAAQAARLPTFHLHMEAQVTGLIEEGGTVMGVHATTLDGPIDVRAALVVGADGRNSTVRDEAGLTVEQLGAPIDVLWFRVPRRPGDPEETMGYFGDGEIMILIYRGHYYQCGLVIPKGAHAELEQRGIESLRERVAEIAPFLRESVSALEDWDAVRLLTVRVDDLREWYRPGLLCIGDAAHAMSPIGGVGINLAVQDAVAAANILAAPLREDRLRTDDLRRVQRRRELPARLTQRAQVLIQDRMISRVLRKDGGISVPWLVRLLASFEFLRRIPGHLIGVGVRPEHVHTPATFPPTGESAAA